MRNNFHAPIMSGSFHSYRHICNKLITEYIIASDSHNRIHHCYSLCGPYLVAITKSLNRFGAFLILVTCLLLVATGFCWASPASDADLSSGPASLDLAYRPVSMPLLRYSGFNCYNAQFHHQPLHL